MKVKLKDVRISFTQNLFVAAEYKKDDGKPRYSSTFLIVPGSANDTALEAAIQAAADAKYGAKAQAMLKGMVGNGNKYCYQNGDTKEYEGYAGMKFVAAHRQAKDGAPKVFGIDGMTLLKENDGIIYGGCYVNAVVDIYAQPGENAGIRCGLIGVQFLRDGVAFSGSRISEGDFEDYSATANDMDGLI